MGRFKAPAPAPPTPASKLKTPMKLSRKTSGTSELSLVAAFDDLMRNSAVFHEGAEQQFLLFVKNTKEWRKKWQHAEAERQRMQHLLNEREKELTAMEFKLKQAREMVNLEMRERQRIEGERDNLQRQWSALQDMINSDGGGLKINNDTLQSIRSRYSPAANRVQRTPSAKRNYYRDDANMAPLVEQSAESLLDASELSYDDCSMDDILEGSRLKTGQVHKRRSSTNAAVNRQKSRRSHSLCGGDKIVATTTVTVNPSGQTHAKAVLESQAATISELQEKVKRYRKSREFYRNQEPSAPPMTTPTLTPNVKRTFSNAGSMPSRPHAFQTKSNMGVKEKCAPCDKKIKFGKTCLKCQDCGVVCHVECKLDVPLPCIRGVNKTPTNKTTGNFLSNYTPVEAPMVPPLLTVCVRAVEERGLNEVGIYRVPGNESESNEILDKLTNARGQTPDLSKYEIHAVTSCIKKFLRSLREPVIPLSSWKVFVDAACNPDSTDVEAAMYQAISELPQPNRDTLAYLIIHLQTVAENSGVNKMGKDNLAMIMGPTILGYSSSDPMSVLSEAEYQKAVIKSLLAISSDYWLRFLDQTDQNLFGFLKTTPEVASSKMFAPLVSYSPLTSTASRTGGPAKRTRSKIHTGLAGSRKQQLFQSPMIF